MLRERWAAFPLDEAGRLPSRRSSRPSHFGGLFLDVAFTSLYLYLINLHTDLRVRGMVPAPRPRVLPRRVVPLRCRRSAHVGPGILCVCTVLSGLLPSQPISSWYFPNKCIPCKNTLASAGVRGPRNLNLALPVKKASWSLLASSFISQSHSLFLEGKI